MPRSGFDTPCERFEACVGPIVAAGRLAGGTFTKCSTCGEICDEEIKRHVPWELLLCCRCRWSHSEHIKHHKATEQAARRGGRMPDRYER